MPTHNKLNKLLDSDLSYDSNAKTAFVKEAKRQLRRLADAMALPVGSYDLRHNKGGMAVSGEVTLHADHIFVQISQPLGGASPVMYRTCDNRKDFTGHQNHFTEAEAFDDDKLASFAQRLLHMTESVAA